MMSPHIPGFKWTFSLKFRDFNHEENGKYFLGSLKESKRLQNMILIAANRQRHNKVTASADLQTDQFNNSNIKSAEQSHLEHGVQANTSIRTPWSEAVINPASPFVRAACVALVKLLQRSFVHLTANRALSNLTDLIALKHFPSAYRVSLLAVASNNFYSAQILQWYSSCWALFFTRCCPGRENEIGSN